MRAKLRADLLKLVPESLPEGHGYCRDETFAREFSGKTLEIVNVTEGTVTLRLPRVVWMPIGDVHFGITQVSVPHEWLWKDVTKDEFQAWKKCQEARS